MDHSQLPILGYWLQNFVNRNELPEHAGFGLDLVLTEAVTNVICHSKRDDAPGEIHVQCTLGNACIEIELVDNGLPFDPTIYQPAAPYESLADAEPGGLGIPLMRRYTSSMQYRRESNRNHLHMTLPFDSAQPAS